MQVLCKAESVWAAWGITVNKLNTALPKGGQGQERLTLLMHVRGLYVRRFSLFGHKGALGGHEFGYMCHFCIQREGGLGLMEK